MAGGGNLELRAPCAAGQSAPWDRNPKLVSHLVHWRHPANLFQLIQKLGLHELAVAELQPVAKIFPKNSHVRRTFGEQSGQSQPENRSNGVWRNEQLISINAKNIEGNVSITRDAGDETKIQAGKLFSGRSAVDQRLRLTLIGAALHRAL